MAAWYRKEWVPGREQRNERTEKREDRDRHDQDVRVEGRKGSVPEWRDGTEKGRSLRGKREDSKEKKEERRERREKREVRGRAGDGDAGMVRAQGW